MTHMGPDKARFHRIMIVNAGVALEKCPFSNNPLKKRTLAEAAEEFGVDQESALKASRIKSDRLVKQYIAGTLSLDEAAEQADCDGKIEQEKKNIAEKGYAEYQRLETPKQRRKWPFSVMQHGDKYIIKSDLPAWRAAINAVSIYSYRSGKKFSYSWGKNENLGTITRIS